MAALRDNDRVRRREFAFRTRAGDIRTGVLSAEIIDIRDEPCMLSLVEDVTEARRLEREIMTIGGPGAAEDRAGHPRRPLPPPDRH